MLERVLSLLSTCKFLVGRLYDCFRSSPLVSFLVTLGILVVLGIVAFCNVALARMFTIPGAVILNLGLFWLLLRLVVRILVFPGSIMLWKRNTEASYRVEMSKQFAHHLEQLHAFLVQTQRSTAVNQRNICFTWDGVLLGCTVVEGLARNFKLQQRDQVKFTAEQAKVRMLVQQVETWIADAKVRDRSGSDAVIPLVDWLHQISRSLSPVPPKNALASMELTTETASIIERIEQLLSILDDLQMPRDNCCHSARRFLRVPTVGSLHQLRAELQVRYSGRHYWIRTAGGCKLDAMLIACGNKSESGVSPKEADAEDAPLKGKEDIPPQDLTEDALNSSTIVWCNPNAGYYETMVYESHWLDFYLSQGCNVCLFNYRGFGRSTGHPTPSALTEDADAVVDFLKRRGVARIGVHGRSIGGLAGCHLAKAHPDVVQILIADRTFSTLARTAKFMFGNWAVQGLSLSATWADNLQNFSQARCYKVMLVDPKDATIPDLASLRTAVAVQEVERLPETDRLLIEDERLRRFGSSWAFFEVALGICDREDSPASRGEARPTPLPAPNQPKRSARQPVIGVARLDGEDCDARTSTEDTQRLVPLPNTIGNANPGVVNNQWLEENSHSVRSLLGAHADVIRAALDVVGSQLNAGGMLLDDALQRAPDDPVDALKCFLSDIQIWGSVWNQRENSVADPDIEMFLAKHDMHQQMTPALACRVARVAATLTPDRLSVYQRQLARAHVAHVRKNFRYRLQQVRKDLEPSADDGLAASRLASAVLCNLREVEDFITALHRFFKRVDIGSEGSGAKPHLSDSSRGGSEISSEESDEGLLDRSSMVPRPPFDRSSIGYTININCGHNGILSGSEMQHLSMHLREARFGRFGEDAGTP